MGYEGGGELIFKAYEDLHGASRTKQAMATALFPRESSHSPLKISAPYQQKHLTETLGQVAQDHRMLSRLLSSKPTEASFGAPAESQAIAGRRTPPFCTLGC